MRVSSGFFYAFKQEKTDDGKKVQQEKGSKVTQDA
jgi:hypothetical protein